MHRALTTALVLAGGRGERLRPLTDDRPKPMVLIDGRPLLEYHLRWLRSQGVTRAVLLVGYRQEVIREYFATEQIPGLSVECVAEPHPLGRGGAIRNGFMEAGVTDDQVIATNGDVVTDQDLAPMEELHHARGALATVMLTRMVSPYGVVDVDDGGLVSGFQEKPALPFWINAGVYVVESSVIERFPVEGDHETGLFPELAQQRRLAGFRSEAFWRSVESAKDLGEASAHLTAHPLSSATGG